jgi:hypothetical protein
VPKPFALLALSPPAKISTAAVVISMIRITLFEVSATKANVPSGEILTSSGFKNMAFVPTPLADGIVPATVVT